MKNFIGGVFVLMIGAVPVSGQVGIGTTSPNAHAVLELKSPGNNQGLITPTLTTAQRTAAAFVNSLGSGDNGLLVYDSDLMKFYYWTGTVWDVLANGTAGGGTVTSVATGTGLSGGPFTTTGTISLANTAVIAGTYGSGTQVGRFTVDAQGRITSATNVTVTGAAPTGAASGDLGGTYPSPTVTKLQGSAVSSTAPTANQVLKWNGTLWLPSPDANSGGTLTNVATGTGLTGGPITSTGTISLANTTVGPGTYGNSTQVGQFIVDAQGRITGASNITITGAAPTGAAGGDLSGNFPNPTVSKLQGSTVSSTAPSTNQVLKWNGTLWLPSADANSGGTVTNVATGTGLSGGPITGTGTISLANTAVTPGTYGTGTQVGQFAVDAQGRVTSAGNVTITGAPPNGTAGGDLGGTFPNPAVTKLQGYAVSTTAPTTNYVLKWNGTTWLPSVDANSGGTVTSVATGTGLTGGPITATGTVSLANTAVTPGGYGTGTQVGQFTVDAQGRITSAGNVTITGAPPNGTAGGDLAGTYPNPTIGTGRVTSTAIFDGTIANVDISGTAGITDGKLATITTAGKVSGNAITSGTVGGSTAWTTTGAITTTNNTITATNGSVGNVISASNSSNGGTGISGITASTNGGNGVYGRGSGITISRVDYYSYGVFGQNTFSTAFGYLGGASGVYGSGDPSGTGGVGVHGDGYYGVTGTGAYIGMIGSSSGNGTYGMYGSSSGTGSYGVYGNCAGTGSYGVFSNGTAGGTTIWFNVSDARYKKNITTLSNSLDKVLRLRGANYDWRTDEFPSKNFSTDHDLGFIAQEIKEVIPEAVMQDKDGFYSVAYGKVVPVLVEAMKEQQKLIEEQNAKIVKLEKLESELNSRLAALEAAISTPGKSLNARKDEN